MLRVRWMGKVRYRDAHALQRGLLTSSDDHLLLLEHPHVFTLGVRARREHVLVDATSVGAELEEADRGGDVTYHGPGQLVGYPILTVARRPNTLPDTAAYVHSVEQLLIDVLADLDLPGAARLDGYPGVWLDADGARPRKIAAVGVRLTRGRSMHGFALNVNPDLSFFDHIVPCGIPDKAVTSLAAEGLDVSMSSVVDAVIARATPWWGRDGAETQHFGGNDARIPVVIAAKGETPVALTARKPEWLRQKAVMGPEFRALKSTMRSLDLVTVCEEAGCPNIFECWNDGTATFMLNGDRCTRACSFCLVDTRRPSGPPDAEEPEHVAEAVARMGLSHAVVTAVARDDLPDGGAAQFAETVRAIRRRCPGTSVELLIPDCKGDPEALETIFEARPDVLNHNLETVLRLQRSVRPSASYARSLAVLARAKRAGLTTKSGIILGMGETEDEVVGAMADLRGVGVDILTLGQYLRPSGEHLPVARWWSPEEFDRLREAGQVMGYAHVESSPLTRSSYHARKAAVAATASS